MEEKRRAKTVRMMRVRDKTDKPGSAAFMRAKLKIRKQLILDPIETVAINGNIIVGDCTDNHSSEEESKGNKRNVVYINLYTCCFASVVR
jgi:hypothetical protein